METWVLRCKLYPEQHRVRDNRLARPSPRGGWNPGAIPGLDRWLSRQNPAYRPGRTKSTARWRCFQTVGKTVIANQCAHWFGARTRSARKYPWGAIRIFEERIPTALKGLGMTGFPENILFDTLKDRHLLDAGPCLFFFLRFCRCQTCNIRNR